MFAPIVAFLEGLFGPFIVWLGTTLGLRVALTVSLVVVFGTIWAALAAAVRAAMLEVAAVLPPGLDVFFWMLPEETPALLTLCFSVDLAVLAYRFAKERLTIKAAT